MTKRALENLGKIGFEAYKGFIWKHENNEYYTKSYLNIPVELEHHKDLKILDYDDKLCGYRTNNPTIVVFTIDKINCKCDSNDHKVPLSEQEQENEMDQFPKETFEREQKMHTSVYENAFYEFVDSNSDRNCQDGERRIMKWEKDNHPFLCCEDRHENRLCML